MILNKFWCLAGDATSPPYRGKLYCCATDTKTYVYFKVLGDRLTVYQEIENYKVGKADIEQ